MTATQAHVQPAQQTDFSQAYNTVNIVAALQSELTALQTKIMAYYQDEVILRGDKIMMREYCGHFGIDVPKSIS